MNVPPPDPPTKQVDVVYSTISKTPPPPPEPPVTTVFIAEEKDQLKEQANNLLSALLLKAQLKETVGKIEKAQPIERRSVTPPLPPPPTEDEVMQLTYPKASTVASEVIQENVELTPVVSNGTNGTNATGQTSPVMEDTVVKMRQSRGQKSGQSTDRRSYVERPCAPLNGKPEPVKDVAVAEEEVKVAVAKESKPTEEKKCLRIGTQPQSIASDLIDGKHPICCVCDIKITR